MLFQFLQMVFHFREPVSIGFESLLEILKLFTIFR
nr:MAG TPA: putative stable inheritance protein [Caudoviricetes sp.]